MPVKRKRVGRGQGGFTLIEVMISVLVLLIGVLGIAGMQMLSLQTNQGAYFRSQAVYIGAEILDAMRANPGDLASYVITVDPLDTSNVPADPGCALAANGCAPAALAALDLRHWARHFADVFGSTDYQPTLPGGRGQITQNGNEYTVQVAWTQRAFDDTNAADGSDTRSVVTEVVQLRAVITP